MAAPERLRLFIGAAELDYSAARITRSYDYLVDTGFANVPGTSGITSSSVVDFKKSDGSTTFFAPVVQDISRVSTWKLQLMGRGYELNNIRVEQVYEDTTPEAIVEDVIDNFSANLTYASTSSSGITIERYVAKAYAIDVIKDMVEILGWQTRIDENDNFYFDPPGILDNGIVLTNGDNFQVTSWVEHKDDMYNHVRIEGGFENFFTSETSTATGTSFILIHKPSDTVKVTEGGSEVDPTSYTVDAESKTVTFDSSVGTPTFEYSYNQPVIVDSQDDPSINTYGEIFQEVKAPWLNRFSDARRYAKNLLSVFSRPAITAVGFRPNMNFDVDVNERVQVIDSLRDKDESLVVSKIDWVAESNRTEYQVGNREVTILDWEAEVMNRVKKLERKFTNDESPIFARLIKNNLSVELVPVITWEWNSPVDSAIYDHETLGRYRQNINFEADCSDNGNHGTWSGSGIGGSQYGTASMQRLSYGIFTNLTTAVSISDAASLQNIWDSGGTVFCRVYIDSDGIGTSFGRILDKSTSTGFNNGWGVYVKDESGSNIDIAFYIGFSVDDGRWEYQLEKGRWYSFAMMYDSGSVSNNPRFFVDGVEVTPVETITPSGSRDSDIGSNIAIGNSPPSSNRAFDGNIDEVMMFNTEIGTARILDLHNKIIDTTNCVGWWSMDNPRYGDRSTARQTIT